jgi:LysM repeat protein
LARAALPWVAATVVVLAAAVAAGFLVAYLVASGRAVDPGSAVNEPTPRRSALASQGAGSSAAQSGVPTEQPRRTPGAPTPEPTPIEHLVSRGEFLSYIAGLYCTTVDEILALNEIQNPNRIQPGDVLVIPGGGCASPEETPG